MKRTLDNLRATYAGDIYLDVGLHFESAKRLRGDAKLQGWTIDRKDPDEASCTQYLVMRGNRNIETLTWGGLAAAHAGVVTIVDYQRFADGDDNYIQIPN